MDFCSGLSLKQLIDVVKKNRNENLVLSPLSYNVILLLIAGGASGDCLKEMLRLLECGEEAKDVHEISKKMMMIMNLQPAGESENDKDVLAAGSNNNTDDDLTAGSNDDKDNLSSGSNNEELAAGSEDWTVGSDDDSDLTAGFGTARAGSRGNVCTGPVVQRLNGIWIDEEYSLKSTYHDLAQTIYNARIKSADFQNKGDEVVDEANAWAKESTKGLVTDVLEHGALDDATILLGNALYFKGFWEDGFEPESTTDRDFHLINGKRKKVPFMTGCNKYSSKSFNGYKVVSIPYQKGKNDGNMFAMYILLPNKRLGLHDLLNEAASKTGFLRKDFKLNIWDHYDEFWIPKFKFSYYTSDGKKIMQEMGLRSPFSDGLQEVVNNRKIQISRIVQKSFIEVDEKGTEAAAVTFAYDECDGEESPSPREKTEFIADHPFMFMIREENTKFILFTGVVLDPTLVQ